MKIPASCLPAALLLAALSATASGAVLVTYNMGTSSAAISTAATTPTAGVGATSLVAGSGVTFQNSGVTLGTSTPRALGLNGSGMSSSEASAITSGRTITFTLTATAGQAISLQSFTMNANLGGTLLAPEFSIRIDTGSGFTTAATGVLTATSGSSGSPFDAVNLALTEPSAGAFSNLTGTVTVQMAFYDTTSPAATWTDWVRMDDITINGTVTAVPEAGSSLLAISGVTLLLARRRRS